jgi:hypothetical protein
MTGSEFRKEQTIDDDPRTSAWMQVLRICRLLHRSLVFKKVLDSHDLHCRDGHYQETFHESPERNPPPIFFSSCVVKYTAGFNVESTKNNRFVSEQEKLMDSQS